MHHAAHAGNADAVRDLLRFGADPRAETKDGETPRALATAPVVQRLLELAEAGRAPANRTATFGMIAALFVKSFCSACRSRRALSN